MLNNTIRWVAQSWLLCGLLFAETHEIALTIDDLPIIASYPRNANQLKRDHERLQKIIQTLIDKQIPAAGFVIAGTIQQGQWELLEQFRQAGFLLGNHTYSHRSLNRLSAREYIDDIDRADKRLSPLFSEQKYFRYPYLAEGRGEKKQQVQDYLSQHHYTVVPVTIDSKDFIFNQQLFAIPYRLRDKNLHALRKRYLAFIWQQTLKAEKKAEKQHPDQPVKHILLIHANLLNSHFLGDIIDLFQGKGYRFVRLEAVLNVPERPMEGSVAKE